MVLESSGSNNHPLRFLSYLESVGGGPGRRAAGGGGDGGGPDWCGRRRVGEKRAGGSVVVLGHEGGTRAEGSEVERVDRALVPLFGLPKT